MIAHCFPNQPAGGSVPRTNRSRPPVAGSTIPAVPSVERSSTTITSSGAYAVASTERTQRSMLRASLRAGMITETRGPLVSGPLVSVIIPARNEARNIERCVRSVLATAYAPLEVIVVDDRSTDGTAGIVEPATGGRLRLVRGTDPPA